ncbi:MAG: SDR family oxidoreductase [Gemmatimonadota bacterium]|nr:MAG: SDR family oxidoreductase [Gemmatimonadota bacterium]
MKELTQRTAIITGASRGIGTYVARALAAEKMNLVLAARSRQNLERVAGGLRASGVKVIAVPTDVTDRKALEALVAAADGEFGGIDVLVNNAGALTVFPYHRIGIEDVEWFVRLNLTSAMILTRLALPGMVARGSGHIVNMSSIAGIWGPPFDEVYGATKAGLIGFTQSLRQEYHGTGISASVICPGYVEEAGTYHEAKQATGIKASALSGRTTPAAVASAVVKAIRSDRPHIIVNTPSVRPLAVLTALSPRFGEWLTRRANGYAPFVKGAPLNLKAGGQMTGLRHSGGGTSD